MKKVRFNPTVYIYNYDKDYILKENLKTNADNELFHMFLILIGIVIIIYYGL